MLIWYIPVSIYRGGYSHRVVVRKVKLDAVVDVGAGVICHRVVTRIGVQEDANVVIGAIVVCDRVAVRILHADAMIGVAYAGVEINESRLELTKTSSVDTTTVGASYIYSIVAKNVGGIATDTGSLAAYIIDTLDIPVDYRDTSSVFIELDENGDTIAAPVGIVTTYTSSDKKLSFTNINSRDVCK